MNRAFLSLIILFSLVTSVFADSFTIATPVADSELYLKAAEKAYKDQSKYWFGKSHPDLSTKCPIKVHVGVRRPSSGSTSFMILGRNSVIGFNMVVSGTRERVLDSIIPHEVSHVVLNTAMGKRIPRCFDEGAATLWENEGERNRLVDHLRGGKSLPIRSVMDTFDYPKDIHTFYAMSHVIVKHLVTLSGPTNFIKFLRDPRPPTAKIDDFYSLTPEKLDAAWRADLAVAAAPTRRQAKRIIYVFTDPTHCAPCRQFEADRKKDRRLRKYNFVLLKQGTPEYTRYHTQFQQTVGKPVPGLPTFWVAGSSHYTAGYSSPGGLLGWIIRLPRNIINAISLIITGEPLISDPPSVTEPNPQPILGPDGQVNEADWTGVRIAIVIKKLGDDNVKKDAALALAPGPISRLVARATGNRAHFNLIAERNNADTFKSVVDVAGLGDIPVHVLVLIPKTNQGLVRRLVLGKVESKITSKLSATKLPIEVIFEREDGKLYGELTALLTSVKPPTAIGGITLPTSFDLSAILPLLKKELPGIVGPVIKREIQNGNIPVPAAIKDNVDRIPDLLSKVNAASGEIAHAKAMIDDAKESGSRLELLLQILVGLCSALGFERGTTAIRAWLAVRKLRG